MGEVWKARHEAGSLIISKTLGQYQIPSPLGKGGMGEVLRVRDSISLESEAELELDFVLLRVPTAVS